LNPNHNSDLKLKCEQVLFQVEGAIKYPGSRPTVLRLKLRLRGTHTGAWNRLDIKSIITAGLEDKPGDEEENVLYETEDWDEGYTANQEVPAVNHKRGLMPFVFVPFEEVETSVLNLPIDKMDYYVAG
jgi:F-box protein 9